MKDTQNKKFEVKVTIDEDGTEHSEVVMLDAKPQEVESKEKNKSN